MIQRMFLVLISLFFVAGCGKDRNLNDQTNQTEVFSKELSGRWISGCAQSTVYNLGFTGDKISIERVKFLDSECQEKDQTAIWTASYQLSSTHKSGVLNAMVLKGPSEVTVTVHKEFDVNLLNDALVMARNAKETQIGNTAGMSPDQIQQIVRANKVLRAAKEVSDFKQDVPKNLNLFQLEYLNRTGLGLESPVAPEAYSSVRYQTDNGYLLLEGGESFARVYHRE